MIKKLENLACSGKKFIRDSSLPLILACSILSSGCEDSQNETSEVEEEVPTPIEVSAPITYSNRLVEAENPSNNGSGRRMMRSNASSARTWLMYEGDNVNYTSRLFQNTEYSFTVRYSDDGGGDKFRVYIENQNIGSFETESTGGWGSGWNKFTYSPKFTFRTPGTNPQEGIDVTIGFENIHSANGSELDCFELKKEE
jgi:hypothetical protein